MKLSQPIKLAGIFVAIVAIYFLTRGLFTNQEVVSTDIAPEQRITVVASTIAAQEWRDEIIILGRTEADNKVIVRAETAGTILQTPATLGSWVSKGDVLCSIGVDARQAQLEEARAALAKAELDYAAAVKLREGGFRSETNVAALKASRDQTAAQAERARLELSKTKITAPYDGIFDNRAAEIGDFVRIGDPCGTVVQPSPILVKGSVSEKDVNKLSVNDRGAARLATGESIEGVLRFIAASADPSTRTFEVELEVPNEDGKLRDGVTAEFVIYAAKRQGYHVPHTALVLNDNGEIGLRTLDSENIVQFTKVVLLGEDDRGVWVDGLAGEPLLITRGQEYVAAGQHVNVKQDTAMSGIRK